MVKGWAAKAPQNFRFTLKMWCRVTHFKRLKGVREDLGVFFERIRPLEPHLGAILYQLPPSLKIHLDQAVEFRHSSWLTEDTFSLLAKYNLAYCIISVPKFPEVIKLTSNISYIRFHGKNALYGSSYSDEELGGWAVFACRPD